VSYFRAVVEIIMIKESLFLKKLRNLMMQVCSIHFGEHVLVMNFYQLILLNLALEFWVNLICIRLVSQSNLLKVLYKLACLRGLEIMLMSLRNWIWPTIVTASLYLQILLRKMKIWIIFGMLPHIVSCPTVQPSYHQ